MFRLKDVLKFRADSGDGGTMFYTALLQVEHAEKLGRVSMRHESKNEFASAVSYYKRAGDTGEMAGYCNVSLMYANGTGVTQSKPAAIAWYYKAGAEYLLTGLWKKALATLDIMKALDKDHRLGCRLQTALNKGEPKYRGSAF